MYRHEILISSAAKLSGHEYNNNSPTELNTYGLDSKTDYGKRDFWHIKLQAKVMQTVIN